MACGPLKKKMQIECRIFHYISTDRKMHPVKNNKICKKNCQIGGKMLHPVYFALSWNFVAVSLANVEKALRQQPLPICRTKSHRLAAFLWTCRINRSPTTSHVGRTQLQMENGYAQTARFCKYIQRGCVRPSVRLLYCVMQSVAPCGCRPQTDHHAQQRLCQLWKSSTSEFKEAASHLGSRQNPGVSHSGRFQ